MCFSSWVVRFAGAVAEEQVFPPVPGCGQRGHKICHADGVCWCGDWSEQAREPKGNMPHPTYK